jgi:SAM-dependent methyltransferase
MTIADALPILVCPHSRAPLTFVEGSSELVCEQNNRRYAIVGGILNVVERIEDAEKPAAQGATERAQLFETMYASQAEPWSYSGRAAEVMRHEFVAHKVRHYTGNRLSLRVLDLGCSAGQLSRRVGEVLADSNVHIFSLDISPTAVAAAQHAVQGVNADYFFLAASSTELPFAADTFDFIVVSDGLHGWELPPELQRKVLEECSRTLKPNGYALFTDYLHPRKHQDLLNLIDSSPLLERVEVDYLYDRLWYRIESWFHAIQHTALAKAFLRNVGLARFLKHLSKLQGANGSKHICVVAQKIAAKKN